MRAVSPPPRSPPAWRWPTHGQPGGGVELAGMPAKANLGRTAHICDPIARQNISQILMVVSLGAAGGCREAVRKRPSCPSRGRKNPHPGAAGASAATQWHTCRDAATQTTRAPVKAPLLQRAMANAITTPYLACGRIWGNSSTSRIEWLLVSSITSRSIPMPSPAVGGRPCSRAVM